MFMLFFMSVLLGLALVSFITLRLGGDRKKPLREGLSASQSLLAISILIIGLAWYFYERPDAERVDVALETEVTSLVAPYVLLRAELVMRNAGISRVDLKGRKASFATRRIKRFPDMSAEQAALLPDEWKDSHDITALLNSPNLIRQKGNAEYDNWDYSSDYFPTILDDRVPLTQDLETGETETQDYFRIFNCNENEIVLIEAAVPKDNLPYENRDKQRFWVEKKMVVLTDKCAMEE